MITRYLRSDIQPFDRPYETVSRDEFVVHGMELVQLNASRHGLIHHFYEETACLINAKSKEETVKHLEKISVHASLTDLAFSAREFVPVVEYVTGALLHLKDMKKDIPLDKYFIERSSLSEERKKLFHRLNRFMTNVMNASSWEHAQMRMQNMEEKMQENKVAIHPREALYLLLPYFMYAQALQSLDAGM